MNKTMVRCLSLAIVVVGVMVIGSGTAFGQTCAVSGTGVSAPVSCSTTPNPAVQGGSYNCTVKVQNDSSSAFTITSLTVGGVARACTQSGSPVTQLDACGAVSGLDECDAGVISGTIPFSCATSPYTFFVPTVSVEGVDAANNAASVSSPNGILVSGIDCSDGNACTDDSCTPTSPGVTGGCVHTPNLACTDIDGRMTGGGSVFSGLNRITHGFSLHCNVADLPNNLQINWGRGNRFHLTELLTATCTDDTAIDQRPPGHSTFDTYVGTGTGLCNGEPGALISFTFTDYGEPGKNDTATIDITGCPAGVGNLSVSGNLKKGNHQAHRAN